MGFTQGPSRSMQEPPPQMHCCLDIAHILQCQRWTRSPQWVLQGGWAGFLHPVGLGSPGLYLATFAWPVTHARDGTQIKGMVGTCQNHSSLEAGSSTVERASALYIADARSIPSTPCGLRACKEWLLSGDPHKKICLSEELDSWVRLPCYNWFSLKENSMTCAE